MSAATSKSDVEAMHKAVSDGLVAASQRVRELEAQVATLEAKLAIQPIGTIQGEVSSSAGVRELAEQMFNAYNQQGPNPWKTFDGRDVPRWHAIGDDTRAKWCAAAAITSGLIESVKLFQVTAAAQDRDVDHHGLYEQAKANLLGTALPW